MLKRPAIFTYLIIAINLLLAWMLAMHQFDTKTILQWGGMYGKMPDMQALSQFPPFVNGYVTPPANFEKIIGGTPLLLIRATYASFLHFSWQHVFSNMLTLYIVGRWFEKTSYFGLLPIIYLITGVFSMIAALILNPHVLTAGASGAVFGIIGVCIMFGFRARHAVNVQTMEPQIGEQVMRLGGYSVMLGVLNMVYTFITPNISIAGHGAGLLAGLVLGLILPMKKSA